MLVNICGTNQTVALRSSKDYKHVQKKDALALKSEIIECAPFSFKIEYLDNTDDCLLNKGNVAVMLLGNVIVKEIVHDKQSCNLPEAILDLYEKYGTDLPHYIKGSFVIVVCNFNKKELIIFNDRSGLYDLNYSIQGRELYFSTDISDFNTTFRQNHQNDDVSLVEHFLFDFPLSNYTFIQGVYSLTPAQIIVSKNDSHTIKTYSSYLDNILSEKQFSWRDIPEKLPDIFNNASRQIVGDKSSICAGLTSGFDSRTNLSSLNLLKRDVLYYSWGLEKSIEIKIAREITDKLKLPYQHISLGKEYEDSYKEYAHQSVLLSNGKSPITRANHAFGFSKLSEHSRLFFTGIAGSELLKPRNCGGYMFTQLYLDLLYQHSLDIRDSILSNKLDTLEVFNTEFINDNRKEIISRTLEHFGEYDQIDEIHNRLYHFMLKYGFRNYFGQEVHSNRIYGHLVSPYLDEDFLEFILLSPIPELNKTAFDNNIRSKIRGSSIYIHIMEHNLPDLLNIETGRYFKPKHLKSTVHLPHLALANLKKRFLPQHPTFNSRQWTKTLMDSNQVPFPREKELFNKTKDVHLDHKSLVKLYSIKYFLSNYLNENA